jgi:ribose 5-phosphate isomerase A
MNAQEQKIAAAREALSAVKPAMRLGLGTGTTSDEFVKLLGAALASGQLTGIRCTCTSNKTEALARSAGIEVLSLAELVPLDLAIDGADEIDGRLRLIKGRGGALLREKIVEQAALRFIVIADGTKLVERLGVGTLPVEVTPFALDVLIRRFDEMGLAPVLRLHDGSPRITDEQHRIVDVRVPHGADIADVVARIRDHAGVVETGFFPTEATEAILSRESGIEWLRR